MLVVKYVGYGWCAAVILGYVAFWLASEHGGGIFSARGWGEIWLTGLACASGIGLIKFAEAKSRQ